MPNFSKSIILILSVMVVAVGPCKSTQAYALAGSKWPQPGPCGPNCIGYPVTLTYSFQNMLDGGLLMPNGQPLPPSIIRGSIEEALGLWASAAPLHFVEVPDDGLGYGLSTQHGQLRFRHIYINGPDPPPPAQPIAKAQAYFPPGPTYAGDVEFDHSDPWQESGTLPIPDVLGAAIHEIGHTLGLNHTDDANANMYWIFHRFQGLGSGQLFPDDTFGIHAIYGIGIGSVTPLAVPEPAAISLLLAATVTWLPRRQRPI